MSDGNFRGPFSEFYYKSSRIVNVEDPQPLTVDNSVRYRENNSNLVHLPLQSGGDRPGFVTGRRFPPVNPQEPEPVSTWDPKSLGFG